MEKYGFVYIWRDRKHNRYYIGSHWGTEDDGYICSSTWMRNSYNRRKNDFKRRILQFVYTREELYEAENKWLAMIKKEEIKTKYYNFNLKAGHWVAYPENVKTIREKIAIKTKEAMQRPDVIANYKEGLKTRDCRSSDPEVRAKRSASMKGKNKGRVYSDTAMQNMKLAGEKRKGRSLSQEQKDKIKSAGIFSSMNKKRIMCSVCGTEGNPGVIARFHNTNCKKRNLNAH